MPTRSITITRRAYGDDKVETQPFYVIVGPTPRFKIYDVDFRWPETAVVGKRYPIHISYRASWDISRFDLPSVKCGVYVSLDPTSPGNLNIYTGGGTYSISPGEKKKIVDRYVNKDGEVSLDGYVEFEKGGTYSGEVILTVGESFGIVKRFIHHPPLDLWVTYPTYWPRGIFQKVYVEAKAYEDLENVTVEIGLVKPVVVDNYQSTICVYSPLSGAKCYAAPAYVTVALFPELSAGEKEKSSADISLNVGYGNKTCWTALKIVAKYERKTYSITSPLAPPIISV